MKGKAMAVAELLDLYPEFIPLWIAAGMNKNLRFYVRKVLFEHHAKMTEE